MKLKDLLELLQPNRPYDRDKGFDPEEEVGIEMPGGEVLEIKTVEHNTTTGVHIHILASYD